MSTRRTTPRYRVEHRTRHVAVRLGDLEGAIPNRTTLDPFVGFLLQRGLGGQVVLVDAATGTVVVRRRVRPFAVTTDPAAPPSDLVIRIQPARERRDPEPREPILAD